MKKTVESKLKYDKKTGMPKIKLELFKGMAVKVSNKEDHDKLMQVYEAGNWCWLLGHRPTDYHNIVTSSPTYIYAKNRFTEAGNPNAFSSIKPVTLEEFYRVEEITPSQIKEINKWFDENKSDRRSLRGKEVK